MKRHQQGKKALGSQALLTIVTKDGIDEVTVFNNLWAVISDFESRFSRFQTTSELTHFNSRAGEKVLVSTEFAELLEACRAMSHKTDGLFNPFILPSLNKAGYIGSWPAPNNFSEELNFEGRTKVVPMNELRLGTGWAKIPSDTALDFGGIGKGFLLDQLGNYLQLQGIEDFWLSLGGDILCSGHDANTEPWSISIQDATRNTELVGTISNSGNTVLGVATSGVTKRKGVRQGLAWHHIIDPRTGEPAVTDILTATVSAATATEADILAKCVVIIGSTQAKTLVSKHKISQLYLQLSDGQTHVLKYATGVEL